MSTDTASIVKLTSVASDLEAAPILSVLHNHGIPARAVGGFTATFRAEAPGEVSILVNEIDLARAHDLLSEVPSEQEQIDWSKIDVGDTSSTDTAAFDEDQVESGDPPKSRDFQFNLLTLLIFQTLFCILLVVFRDARAALVCALMLFLLSVVTGTTMITSDPRRARKWLRYGLIIGLAVEAFLLISQIL